MTEIIKVPTKKLWNPKSFIAFSAFFSFLPAGIMCALNYGRCGNQQKKRTCLLLTIFGFIALIASSIIFSINSSGIFFAINIGVGIYLMNIQRGLYEEHIQNGGEKASYFLPIITGVLISALFIALYIYSTSYLPKNSLVYGKSNVYYTNSITKSQAKKLGDYLKSEGFFTNDSEKDIKIDKQKDFYIFSIIVKDDYLKNDSLNNKEFVKDMKAISKSLSQDVFENSKVQIDICNNRFKALKSISAD